MRTREMESLTRTDGRGYDRPLQPAFMSANPLFQESSAYQPRLTDPLQAYDLGSGTAAAVGATESGRRSSSLSNSGLGSASGSRGASTFF
jgi:hypothetical protein